MFMGLYVFSFIYTTHHSFHIASHTYAPLCFLSLSLGCTDLEHKQISERISMSIPIANIRSKIYKPYIRYLVFRLLQPLKMRETLN
ncbi:hypothetical protein LINPERPRIM_LOCUS29523 [Linum perenne]